jgi:hypothetical protein
MSGCAISFEVAGEVVVSYYIKARAQRDASAFGRLSSGFQSPGESIQCELAFRLEQESRLLGINT